MKKRLNYLFLTLVCLSLTSCDIDEVMNSVNTGVQMYQNVRQATRGEAPGVVEMKNVEFKSSRGENAMLLGDIKDLRYVTYPDVDASFRDKLLNKLKESVKEDDFKKEVCNDQQCVINYKNEGILIFNQNGNDLDAMVLKGKFTSSDIQKSISSGSIFKIRRSIKKP